MRLIVALNDCPFKKYFRTRNVCEISPSKLPHVVRLVCITVAGISSLLWKGNHEIWGEEMKSQRAMNGNEACVKVCESSRAKGEQTCRITRIPLLILILRCVSGANFWLLYVYVRRKLITFYLPRDLRQVDHVTN